MSQRGRHGQDRPGVSEDEQEEVSVVPDTRSNRTHFPLYTPMCSCVFRGRGPDQASTAICEGRPHLPSVNAPHPQWRHCQRGSRKGSKQHSVALTWCTDSRGKATELGFGETSTGTAWGPARAWGLPRVRTGDTRNGYSLTADSLLMNVGPNWGGEDSRGSSPLVLPLGRSTLLQARPLQEAAHFPRALSAAHLAC